MDTLHYIDCGLDNVYLHGVSTCVDDAGQEVLTIPAIGILHKAIAESVLKQEGLLSSREVRFLRTEMGLTQTELAELLGKDEQTIARWEKGVIALPKAEEMILRVLAYEILSIGGQPFATEMSKAVRPSAAVRTHNIDFRPNLPGKIKYEPRLDVAA